MELGDVVRAEQVLVDCPDGLCELRAVALKQQEWRAREGLSA